MKVAVITGGTRGIGSATCAALLKEGYSVVSLARTAPPAESLQGVRYIACNVAERASVRAAFDRIRDELGRVDVLVNNAGIAGADRLDDWEDGTWSSIMGTNLSGAYYCTKAALPLLARNGGRVVFVGSVLSLRGVGDQIAYTASKHGLIGLTRAFALRLAPSGITSNAVCPGWVDTEMAERRYAELKIDASVAARQAPLRGTTSPDEVAAAIVFLSGEAAARITGQILVIDGGVTA
jgi:NAD(P)-dependent dehydrogenase (short-subunit alcohol dehydrogenase family)